MTTTPEPERPFRVTVTPRRVEELQHLADNAEAFSRRIAGDNDLYFGYGLGVRDALRWLAGNNPTEDLTQTVAD